MPEGGRGRGSGIPHLFLLGLVGGGTGGGEVVMWAGVTPRAVEACDPFYKEGRGATESEGSLDVHCGTVGRAGGGCSDHEEPTAGATKESVARGIGRILRDLRGFRATQMAQHVGGDSGEGS